MPFLNSEARLKSHPHRVEIVQKDTAPSVFHAFNKHARECSRCAKPIEVARRKEMLCDIGHRMAYDVAEILYDIAGNKAEEYRATTGWYGILMNLTEFDGPVVDLVRAMDYGLRERKPASVQAPVFYGSVRSTRHLGHEHREGHSSSSRHHHHHGHHSHHHYDAPSPRSDNRVTVHRPEPERSPRVSGSLRVHVPLTNPGDAIESGRDVSYYEEVYHRNGGKVTTKYYHHERPRLQRSNTIGTETTTHQTVSTGKSGSKVRFAI